MAGHSKWAQIKRSKAVKDAKKGATFARISRDIMVAARMGGPDPAGNFRLRTAIEKAKEAALPSENIQRAIDKGSGKGEADNMETLYYEGYGPGGVAILIQTMTDNRNRTAGDIRSYFNKYQGNLGSDGCVSWIFEERGEIRIASRTLDEDALMSLAIEAGSQDVFQDEEGPGLITTPDTLNTVCQSLNGMGHAIESAEITRRPSNAVAVTDPTIAKPLFRLLDAIESQDDVQEVFTNFEMSDELIQQFAGGF